MKNGFIEIANKELLGKKIASIEYMASDDAENSGWNS